MKQNSVLTRHHDITLIVRQWMDQWITAYRPDNLELSITALTSDSSHKAPMIKAGTPEAYSRKEVHQTLRRLPPRRESQLIYLTSIKTVLRFLSSPQQRDILPTYRHTLTGLLLCCLSPRPLFLS